MVKETIRGLFRILGYEIGRVTAQAIDPFVVQHQIISVAEPTIFDVGAHVGAVSKKYRELFPLAWIHAFEPSPHAFGRLSASAATDTRLLCHNVAISNADATGLLHLNASSPTNSLLSPGQSADRHWGPGLLESKGAIRVQTRSLDSFCAGNQIGGVDILKLDVQGVEYRVLEGAAQLLSRQAISVVYTEILIAPTYQNQRKLHEYLELLDSYNYTLLDMYNPVRRKDRLLQVDAMFVNRAVLARIS